MLVARNPTKLPQLLRLVVATWFFSTILSHAEEPDLRIVFGPRSTILSGRLASEATAEVLVNTVKTARPELPPDRSGLVIDPGAPEFPAGDLKSLLAEIALSTHEGRLEIWPDRLVIGGLTDSLVTQSALRIRAEPFLRKFHGDRSFS